MTHATVERLVLIKLAHAVIWFGVKDRNEANHVKALARLATAEHMELEHLPRPKQESAQRHAQRNADALLAPYIAQRVDCAKFGLALIYVIQELANLGLFEANEAFSDVLENGLMNEEGTIVERHNVEPVSASAVKMGRKIITALNSLGYFNQTSIAA